MAVDKLVDSAQLDADLEDIADAIRAKGGTSASLAFPAGFVSAVQAIPTGITPAGTKSITENGTYDVTQYASASVSVPNTYSAGDEGKVVSNGALVAQTSDTVTINDTYDTTLINSLTVNVSGGGTSPISKLGEVTVSENVRAVNLDLTPYASYDLVIVISDVTLNSADWLYYVKNGSSPSGGTYGNSVIHHYGLCIGIWLGSSNSIKYNVVPSGGGYTTGSEDVSNLYIYAYNSSKYITAGSKFKIYGGNYADM